MFPTAALPPPPPSATPAAATVIEGRVSCDGCPPGPIHVQAWSTTDRYHWPWWNVYGFLTAFHKPEELDRLRPQPIAGTTLEGPGRFRLALPAGVEAHLFARLDAGRHGPAAGAAAGDWIGRFPRNPAPLQGEREPLSIELYPLIWAPDYERLRYQSPAAPEPAPRFTDVTESSGALFQHCQGGDRGHLPVVVGGGALLEDLDGDRDLDLLVVQGLGMCEGAAPDTALFANDGRGHFRDVSRGSGLEVGAAGMGVTGGDIDRDGDIDLFITTYRGGRLFRNDGQLRFTEITRTAGVGGGDRWPVAASFGDVDGDGWLDLFVANYVSFSTDPPFTPDAEIPTFVTAMLSSPFAFPAQPDRLYLGRKQGSSFEEAPAALGAADPEGKGMGAILADLDHDGDLDLFVTNDCSSDRLFEWRQDRFHDVSRAAGVADLSSGMGIAHGDIDGDGLADLFSPHWLNEPRVLYRNLSRGQLRFEERTREAGLAASGNGRTGWAATLFDADLDGDLDLLVSNGHTHPGKDPKALEPQPLQLFENDGNGRFRDVSRASGPALLEAAVWRGAAVGDIDGDGDLDAYVVAWNGVGKLLRNESEPRGGKHWLGVRLWRQNGERGAIGARVELTSGGRRQTRAVVSGTSYLSHSALDLVFGLGPGKKVAVDSLEVIWPGGRRERFKVAAVDRSIELREGTGAVAPPVRP